MENSNDKEKLQAIISSEISGFLEKMGVFFDLEIKTEEEKNSKESFICNIKTPESNFLIGQYGVNLASLQHIIRLVIRKKINEPINLTIDVNSYREEKNESILSLAQEMAQKAILEKKEVTLRPMSAYERRLVHMELSKNNQIETESVGEGEDRRIMIKPLL